MTTTYIHSEKAFNANFAGKISVLDHAVLYGDGVYDTFRVYNGKAFKLSEHIERLYESAKFISLNPPVSKTELRTLISQTWNISGLDDGFFRILFTRGVAEMGVDIRNAINQDLIIILVDRPVNNQGVILITTSRYGSRAYPECKSLNYMTSILAKIEAVNKGYDDAILLDDRGFVTEGTTENIFMVSHGEVYTPSAGILKGVVRDTIMEIHDVKEYAFYYTRLYEDADEVFLTGTGIEIAPVIKIDWKLFKEGPITKEIRKKYNEVKMNGEPL